MKQQKVIGIEREEYLSYLLMYGQFQNIQVPGFRQNSNKPNGSQPSERSLIAYAQRIALMIGPQVQKTLAAEKIKEFLKHFTNVKDVLIRVRDSRTKNLAFEIDIDFDGEEKPLSSGATETLIEQNQNLMEGGSMDGLLEDSTDINDVK